MEGKNSKGSSLSSDSFDDLNAQIQQAALKLTKQTLSIPPDLAFYRSMDNALAQNLDAFSIRVRGLLNNLMRLTATLNGADGANDKFKRTMFSQDDLLDNFNAVVVDAVDRLLERTDMCLDEYLGRNKAPAIAINPPTKSIRKTENLRRGALDPALQHASHLRKPQLDFKRKVDNRSDSPWYPTLPHKYNAQMPLGYISPTPDDEFEWDAFIPPKKRDDHPYRYEIKHTPYPSCMFASDPPIKPKSFEETPFIFVSTPAQFADMLEKLRKVSELALDLEHHSYRTYAGFLCLMQISTREEDWIVDLLAVRDEVGELNEVLTNPAIIKVLHGAESDIVWLQQDFSLYIVNLFDTYHATNVLDFPRHGLAHLLEVCCDFVADKRYQLADWRIRPLPEAMVNYARSDTHFLLYIYDELRNALLDRASSDPPILTDASQPAVGRDRAHTFVYEVLRRSEATALRVYTKEPYCHEFGMGAGGWDTLAFRWNKWDFTRGDSRPNRLQTKVYRAVHAWRDRVAREEDESTRYVLPDRYLFELAEKPPANAIQLTALFRKVPPIIRQKAAELLSVIGDVVNNHDKAVTSRADDMLVESSQAEENPDLAGISIATRSDGDKLWSKDSELFSVPSSSLFKDSLTLHALATPLVSIATKSLLFGDTLPSSTAPTSASSSQFGAIVARIHSSLVLAPTIPKITPGSTAVAADAVPESLELITSNPDSEAPSLASGMLEIPYVPASARRTTQIVEDSIVVVGQPRQKKRRRTKTMTTSASGVVADGGDDPVAGLPSAALDEALREETEPPRDGDAADHTVVSGNILDRDSDAEMDASQQRGKKRVRPKTGNGKFAIEYGNFGRPPKAHREVKSGNLSRTFK